MSKPLTMASSGYQMSDPSLCGQVTTSGLPIKKIPRKKIHCILPSSPWLADSKTNVPLGVLYIAGLLRENGHEIVVTSMLDKRYEGNIHLPDHVMDADVHMFGFCTPQFGEALELAAYIRDRAPDALLVAGGPHPSYEPQEVKLAGRQDTYHFKGRLPTRRDYRAQGDEKPLFDTVIVMEGEVATLQMLTDWDAGKLQPYYYGDKADAMDLNAIPFPAWDLLPHDHIYNEGSAVMKHKYFPNEKYPEASSAVMSLIGTRGCPYKCTYCFVFNTLVDMADGSQIPIQNLKVGDRVLSFDQSTGYTRAQRISTVGLRQADDVYEMVLSDGTVLGVTGDHPFVTPEGWRRVRTLDSGSYVRRLRRTDNDHRPTGTPKDVLRRVPNEGRGTSTWRDVAQSAHGTDGQRQSDGQSRDISQDDGNDHTTVRRGAAGCVPETSDTPIRAGSGSFNQTQKTAEARHTRTHSRISEDEGKQPYASSRRSRENECVTQESIRGGEDQPTFASGVQRSRASVVRLLRDSWIAHRALWRKSILDWALSIRQETQSRYAAFLRASSNPVLSPSLAYAGGYGYSDARLRQQGMGGPELLGGFAADECEQEFGRFAGERISGDWVRVKSITFVGRGTVYPISVANDETFFAHGIATHNCSTPWIGQMPRYRSPENIIAEMSLVMDKGVRMFKFQDDTYTLHRKKLRELSEAIHSVFGPDSFAARIHTRVNTMDDHIAESLKLMNTKVTCFGIESGSQKVLDANQKGTTVKQNTDALIKAKEHGFYTIAFLVIGMAGETVDTMRETMNWLQSVKPYLDSCNLAVGIPYPGSRWWTHPAESGIDIIDYNYDNQWIVGFSARDEILVRPHGATVDEMFKIKKEMFDFLVYNGWAKAEWDEDVRIKQQQSAAVAAGTLSASGLSYAGH